MKKQYIQILLLVLLVLVGCKKKETTVSADLSVPVSVLALKPSTIEEYLNSTGTVYPVSEVELSSQMVGEYYLQINPRTNKTFALGDKVNKGEVIVRIVDRETENQIKMESVKLDYEISKMEFEKQTSLYEKGGVTLRELKNAEISNMNKKLDLENAQIKLEKMKVVAPFTGVITDLPYVTNVTRITSNTVVVKLMNYSEMYCYVNLPEKYYSSIRSGIDVVVTNYSIPDDTLRGVVEQISPAIDPDARTFKCMVSIDNQQLKLLPGMFVKTDLVTKRSSGTVVIPKEIVKGRGNQRSVFIVENGSAEMRQIRTGIENTDNIEVISGLEVEDRVVIKGYETLRHRSKVKVLNEENQKKQGDKDGEKQNNRESKRGNERSR